MSANQTFIVNISRLYLFIKQALRGETVDYTKGRISKAVLLLAIPMMLEVSLESVFALVDLYFVGHLKHSNSAVQTVGLTEAVLLFIYSVSIGLSTAATAIVARRIGEKNYEAAGLSGIQSIVIASGLTLVLSIVGVVKSKEILEFMGASKETLIAGLKFTQISMASSCIVMLLFLINGIFRGAGNAVIAMKSLWIANICNIVFCPLLIKGFWVMPALGLTGAAVATLLARSIGIGYQLYNLLYGNHLLKIKPTHFLPDIKIMKLLISVASPNILQFVIGSCSWVFLAQLVALTGGDYASAGYQTALRLMEFFMLPAWGLSNAASTLVGQNLGAKHFERAVKSVKLTALYNMFFMFCVTLFFYFSTEWLLSCFTTDRHIIVVADQALYIMSVGFIIYGVGMVYTNAFNGAGDTWTPTWIAMLGFWVFQIPLAYLLAKYLYMGPKGVFISMPVAETVILITSFTLFKQGRWKNIKV